MSSRVAAVGPVSHFPSLRDSLWSWAGGVSVRTKILGILLALTAILGLGVTWQVRAVMGKIFIAELEQRGFSVVSDLASRIVDPILLNDTFGIHQLLTDTILHHPDALYAFVVDPDGRVIAHTFGESGFPLALLRLDAARLPINETERHIQHLLYRSEQGIVHEFRAPIFDGRSGVLRLGLTESRLTRITNAITGQMLLTTLMVALAGIAAASLLTWLLTRPILALVETTRQVGQGDLSARALHWADDEIGALADAFNQMAANLEVSRQAIAEKDAARTHLLEQLITAQEEERKRIARELHDDVGQALTSLIVGMKVVGQMEAAEMGEKLESMRHFAAETLEQVRLLSRQLRPSVLDDLGLVAALKRYADEFSQGHPQFSADLHSDLTERLPPLVETTLYRIVQEAMTNAARHSGGSAVSVLLTRYDGHVRAIVEDDGSGFDVEQARRAGRSVGIHGMAERAELVGGHLEIESSDDGTTVYVEVPL